MMNWYEVRCCCTPRKVFGWYPVPAGMSDFSVIPREPLHKLLKAGSADVPEQSDYLRVHFRLRTVDVCTLSDGRRDVRLAIYSDDHDIEFWRRVPGFVEAPPI